jgi:hypothetical protein
LVQLRNKLGKLCLLLLLHFPYRLLDFFPLLLSLVECVAAHIIAKFLVLGPDQVLRSGASSTARPALPAVELGRDHKGFQFQGDVTQLPVLTPHTVLQTLVKCLAHHRHKQVHHHDDNQNGHHHVKDPFGAALRCRERANHGVPHNSGFASENLLEVNLV